LQAVEPRRALQPSDRHLRKIGDASANLTASQLAQYPNLKPIPICVDAIGIIV